MIGPLALNAQNIIKAYPTPSGARAQVINIPLFQIKAGQQVALRGESGLGKTTLLHMIAGIVVPDSGLIEVGGSAMTGLSESQRDRLRAGQLGYIFQTFNLLQGLSVLENVELGLAFGKGMDRDTALESLKRVGMDHRVHYFPRQLSTGQQQRVAVARALANHPCLILADEPTGNLDAAHGQKVITLLRESASAMGSALCVASHDPEVLASFDEVIDLAELNQARPQVEEL